MPLTVNDFLNTASIWHVAHSAIENRPYENVSHLPAPMQDAFCVLATGGGFAKRKLYSDADEAVINVKRPVILNGISACVTAQDLVDRTITVETPVITAREEVTDLWRDFERERPRILGALLDLFSDALALLPNVRLAPEKRPRLAEFARLGMAVAKAVGKPEQAFLDQFEHSRKEAIGRTLDASPVATAVLEWIADNPAGAEDAAKCLLASVEKYKPAGTDAWPRSAKGFADALRRAAPALRQMGVECRCLGKQSGGTVRWCIRPREKSSDQCPRSPKSRTHADPDLGHGTFGTLSPQVSSPARCVLAFDTEAF